MAYDQGKSRSLFRDPDRWLLLIIPIGISLVSIGVQVVCALLGQATAYYTWFEGELGFIENATVVVALGGLVLSLSCFKNRVACPWRFFGAWVLLFALAFVYIAGEEASWGQHWVGWATPDWYAAVNTKGETNIHNLSFQIERLPKAIVGTSIVLGGLVWPTFNRLWPAHAEALVPVWLDWMLPRPAARTAALCFFLVWLLSRALIAADFEEFGTGVQSRGQNRIREIRPFLFVFTELRELLMVYFLMIYVWLSRHRLLHER